MAALAATTPTRTGTAVTGNAVAASDTIAGGILGPKGAILEILNGGGSVDNMTISDAGSTPAGTPPGTYAASVTNGTNKVFTISPLQVDPTTGLVTITHSFTTSVTYKLYPQG
jgi:hypothetical protein